MANTHEKSDLFWRDIVDRLNTRQGPLRDHSNTVAQREDFIEVLRDDQNRATGFGE